LPKACAQNAKKPPQTSHMTAWGGYIAVRPVGGQILLFPPLGKADL